MSAIVAGAMSAISGIMGAVGGIEQGQSAAAAASYNAQIQEQNAKIAKQNAANAVKAGEQNAGMSEQKSRAEVGAIKAAQAANNIDVNTGSAVDVRSSASQLGELSALTIRNNAAREAWAYQNQSISAEMQANLDKQQAAADQNAGMWKAGTGLFGAAGTFFGNEDVQGWFGSGGSK